MSTKIKEFHNVILSDAEEKDFDEIQKMYAPYVLNTTVTLEEIPPDAEEMKSRWRHSVDKGLPYIVAKTDGTLVGYAYAFLYRSRSGYRFTVEESVYVADEYQNTGIGRKLLSALISACREKTYTQMVAVIAGTDNLASIKFHESLGFSHAGTLKNVGFKFGKWVNTVLMQKEL